MVAGAEGDVSCSSSLEEMQAVMCSGERVWVGEGDVSCASLLKQTWGVVCSGERVVGGAGDVFCAGSLILLLIQAVACSRGRGAASSVRRAEVGVRVQGSDPEADGNRSCVSWGGTRAWVFGVESAQLGMVVMLAVSKGAAVERWALVLMANWPRRSEELISVQLMGVDMVRCALVPRSCRQRRALGCGLGGGGKDSVAAGGITGARDRSARLTCVGAEGLAIGGGMHKRAEGGAAREDTRGGCKAAATARGSVNAGCVAAAVARGSVNGRCVAAAGARGSFNARCVAAAAVADASVTTTTTTTAAAVTSAPAAAAAAAALTAVSRIITNHVHGRFASAPFFCATCTCIVDLSVEQAPGLHCFQTLFYATHCSIDCAASVFYAARVCVVVLSVEQAPGMHCICPAALHCATHSSIGCATPAALLAPAVAASNAAVATIVAAATATVVVATTT
eukprot:scaffold160192_cov18-Tisochrysis_lutea.AAC.1